AAAGWRGSVSRLTADSAGFALALERPVLVALDPEAVARAERDSGSPVNAPVPAAQRRISLDASWDLKFAGA
ncbi:hypothetical protein, partial [Bordetella pertussis]|uniref:hypothetical protein n=1 Tax=Bordetella pertussis TaxID=520 RepID=UPI0012B1801B